MKMSKKEYGEYVKKKTPNSPVFRNVLKAYLVGGLICCVGQGILKGWTILGLGEDNAAAFTSITLVFLGALFTGFQLYHKLAKFAGAGTLVPITGFSNAITSPAIEFKTEGFVTGVGAKMFTIAGPVIVYGVSASVVYGILYWVWMML